MTTHFSIFAWKIPGTEEPGGLESGGLESIGLQRVRINRPNEHPNGLILTFLIDAHIMASGPITLWQIDGEIMLIVTDFLFLGSRITVGDDYRNGVKAHLFLEGEKKCNKTRQHIKKQRHY